MDSKQLRIVYMGTPDFAVAPLRRMVDDGYNVVGVITMPDKPAGRGLKMHESAVKQYAVKAGLCVLQPVKLKDPAFVEQFTALEADLAIVIAFRMLPQIIWAQPRLGTFNLHASLLPQYRGAAPINWAIINGEKTSGVTTFMLNEQIDKGNILGRAEVSITNDDTAGTLHDKLMNVGTELVVETVEKIANGTAQTIEQSDHTLAVELKGAPKIFKEDCKINWNAKAQTINNLIRGLSPYPAAWTTLECGGKEPVAMKIFAASVEYTNHNLLAGEIVSDSKSHLKVACEDGYILINELQLAGKRRMSSEEFLRGFKDISSYKKLF